MNKTSEIAMMQRVADGRTDLVFDFVNEGGPASAADNAGVSLMQWCAYYGDVSAIRFLLTHGEKLESLGPNSDLNGAAFHGHWQLCQFLLEHGADPNFSLPGTAETPLHAAVSQSTRPAHNHVLAVLFGHAADPNRATAPGVATSCFMRDCVTKGETPLHRAAGFADEEAIAMLLDAGARIDAKDANGETPLSWASWHGRPTYIVELLCYGEHRVHPMASAQSRRDPRMGWTSGMAIHLLGAPHV